MKFLKDLFVFCLGAVSFIYLLNPGAGFFEALPDNIPLVGNIDEATAALILFGSLRYFGLDFQGFFQRKPPAGPTPGRK